MSPWTSFSPKRRSTDKKTANGDGCWARVRLEFEAALQADDDRAIHALAFISALYETGRLAAAQHAGAQSATAALHTSRGRSTGRLGPQAPGTLVPGTPLTKAISTMLDPGQDLLVVVREGRAEVRPVGVGRKAYSWPAATRELGAQQ